MSTLSTISLLTTFDFSEIPLFPRSRALPPDPAIPLITLLRCTAPLMHM